MEPSIWSESWQFSSMGLQEIVGSIGNPGNGFGKHVVLDLSVARQSVVDLVMELDHVYTVTNAVTQLVNNQVNQRNFFNDNDNDSLDYNFIFEALVRYREKNLIPRPVSVIFVWDLLNYLTRDEIINLMAYLSPFCFPGTSLFAISWMTEMIPSKPGLFEVTPSRELVYYSQTGQKIKSPEYSAPLIAEMMPSFSPHRLSITRMGMLEVLMKFNELVTPPNPNMIPFNKLSAHSKI